MFSLNTPAKHEERGAEIAAKPRVLLVITADLGRDRQQERLGAAPHRDYLELAAQLGRTDILDLGSVERGWLGRRLRRFAPRGILHAVNAAIRSRHYDFVFSDSEHVGLPLGVLLRFMPKRPRHVVLAHHLTPPKKHLFVRLAKPGVDAFVFHSEAQRLFAISKLGLHPSALNVLPYQVDLDFWQPRFRADGEVTIATAGLECRDYDTLIKATRSLPVKLVIGASSNWSQKQNPLQGYMSSNQVSVSSYSYDQLRNVYNGCRFVVVPLLDVDFQAGITTILEGMAMAKAVVTTKTQGHSGAVVGPVWQAGRNQWPRDFDLETATGIYVSPADADGLRDACSFLLTNPLIAETLGKNGRARAATHYTLHQFADRFSQVIDHSRLTPDSNRNRD